jgi:hypothetical protein
MRAIKSSRKRGPVADLWGTGAPDSAVIMLAQLMLKRAKLNGMKAEDRQGALAIIRGLRPAIAKTRALTSIVLSAVGKKARETSFCSSCGKPLPFGSLCRTLWTMNDGTHIKCAGTARPGFIQREEKPCRTE